MLSKTQIKSALKNNLFYVDFFIDFLEKNKEQEKEIVKELFGNLKDYCWLIKEIIMESGKNDEYYSIKAKEFIIKYKKYFYNLYYKNIVSKKCTRTSVKYSVIIMDRIHDILPDIIEKSNILDALWEEFGLNIIPQIKGRFENYYYLLLDLAKEKYDVFVSAMISEALDGWSEIINIIEDIDAVDDNLSEKICYDVIKELIKIKDNTVFTCVFENMKFRNPEKFLNLITKESNNVDMIINIVKLNKNNLDDACVTRIVDIII